MGIRKLKPTTPGQRHKVIGAFDKITASTPEKSLVVGKKSTGGRNNTGKMTMRYIGGGHKQKYRIIDFKRNKDGIPATVKSIEYDPNRSSRIALLYYADGAKSYIIAPNGLEVGQTVVSGSDAAPEVGNTLPMANIPVGTIIHNIELRPGQGAKMVRSAGKAGRSRWLGRRPRNRGVVMNPVDHPMGGGEGRSSGGHPRSRNGLYAKGLKTRAPKKHSSKYIIERRKK